MWDAFVLDRLYDEKEREENLTAMGMQHVRRQRQRERETASLRGAWAQAVDAKKEAAGAGGARGRRRGANE